MDDPIYAQSAVRKIQAYEENDIYPGERLILAFETERTALDAAHRETCLQVFDRIRAAAQTKLRQLLWELMVRISRYLLAVMVYLF